MPWQGLDQKKRSQSRHLKRKRFNIGFEDTGDERAEIKQGKGRQPRTSLAREREEMVLPEVAAVPQGLPNGSGSQRQLIRKHCERQE